MKNISDEACLQALQKFFHKNEFRSGQLESIKCILEQKDLFCVFPTGAGKSLCYQLPAMMMDGLTIVISPLLALMHDQVNHLLALGLQAAMLSSEMTDSEKQNVYCCIKQGRIKLLYVAPERLHNHQLLSSLQSTQIACVVVDEAHCVLKWGLSFRPDYLSIDEFIRRCPNRPVICAMTATADRWARYSISKHLGMNNAKSVILPVARSNLSYNVLLTAEPDKELLRLLPSMPDGKGIIYCTTRAETERVARFLSLNHYPCTPYHAGLLPEQRECILQRISSGSTTLIAATIAFGMGIDIPDFRFIIHMGMPADVDAYMQETGRAGRNGEHAVCTILMYPRDFSFRKNRLLHLQPSASQEKETKKKQRIQAAELSLLIRILLSGKCIQQQLSRHYGQHNKPCGHCSACLVKAYWPSVLHLKVTDSVQLRYWWLTAITRKYAIDHAVRRDQLPSSAELFEAARKGTDPRIPLLHKELTHLYRSVLNNIH